MPAALVLEGRLGTFRHFPVRGGFPERCETAGGEVTVYGNGRGAVLGEVIGQARNGTLKSIDREMHQTVPQQCF